jgi:hypothetical protein
MTVRMDGRVGTVQVADDGRVGTVQVADDGRVGTVNLLKAAWFSLRRLRLRPLGAGETAGSVGRGADDVASRDGVE